MGISCTGAGLLISSSQTCSLYIRFKSEDWVDHFIYLIHLDSRDKFIFLWLWCYTVESLSCWKIDWSIEGRSSRRHIAFVIQKSKFFVRECRNIANHHHRSWSFDLLIITIPFPPANFAVGIALYLRCFYFFVVVAGYAVFYHLKYG